MKIRDKELLRPDLYGVTSHAKDSATEIYPVELSRKSQRPTRLRRGQTHAILAAQIPRGPPRTSSAYDGNAMRSFPAFLLFVCLLFIVGCSKSATTTTATKENSVVADDEASVKLVEATGAKLKKDGNGNVVNVDFRGTSVDDEALKSLSGMKQLTHLDLRDCAITDEGVASLGSLSKLKALRFSGKSGATDITDKSMAVIGTLTNLKLLAIDFAPFAGSAEGFQQLSTLKNLEEVYASKTLVNDETLEVLATTFPSLKKLRASAAQVSSEGLQSIAKMKKLEELDLSENTAIFDDGLAHLAEMTQLKKLNLWRVPITDEGVVSLAGLTNMEWLNLDNVQYLSDDGLVHLKGMTKLKFLHLGSTAVTDAGMKHLEPLTSLDDLKVTRTGVTEEGVAELKKTLPKTAIQLKYVEGK